MSAKMHLVVDLCGISERTIPVQSKESPKGKEVLVSYTCLTHENEKAREAAEMIRRGLLLAGAKLVRLERLS